MHSAGSAYGFEGDLVAEARELIVKGGNVILLKSVNKGTVQGVDVTRVVSGAPSIRYDISPQESQTPDDTSTKDYAKEKCCNCQWPSHCTHGDTTLHQHFPFILIFPSHS